MKGAIVGNIVGSCYVGIRMADCDRSLFSQESDYRDAAVMTVAIAKAIVQYCQIPYNGVDLMANNMRALGRQYPNRGYSARMQTWIDMNEGWDFRSWGDGAPARCSAAGYAAHSPEEARFFGELSAKPTHASPSALKASGLVAELIFQARNGAGKNELKKIAEFDYDIPRLSVLHKNFRTDLSCEVSMPVALAAFFESKDFDSAIRNVISIGADSDTIAAITGGIAEAFYGGVPENDWI